MIFSLICLFRIFQSLRSFCSRRRKTRFARRGAFLSAFGRRASSVERRASNVERRTSNVERRTSNVERRTSNVERRTSNVERQVVPFDRALSPTFAATSFRRRSVPRPQARRVPSRRRTSRLETPTNRREKIPASILFIFHFFSFFASRETRKPALFRSKGQNFKKTFFSSFKIEKLRKIYRRRRRRSTRRRTPSFGFLFVRRRLFRVVRLRSSDQAALF